MDGSTNPVLRSSATASPYRTAEPHAIYACLINHDWPVTGRAAIVCARVLADHQLVMAAYWVDRWAMGLKDAWGHVTIASDAFERLSVEMRENLGLVPAELDTARHLVHGGVGLASELGFQLPMRHARWLGVIGMLPAGTRPRRTLFLRRGRVCLRCTRRELDERLLHVAPDAFLARSDVTFEELPPGAGLYDGHADMLGQAVTQLEGLFLSRAREWCTTRKIPFDEYMPAVLSAMTEVLVQTTQAERVAGSTIELRQRMKAFFAATHTHVRRQKIHVAWERFEAFRKDSQIDDQFLAALNLK